MHHWTVLVEPIVCTRNCAGGSEEYIDRPGQDFHMTGTHFDTELKEEQNNPINQHSRAYLWPAASLQNAQIILL